MSNLRRPKPWEHISGPPIEERDYLNRRQVLRSLGLISLGLSSGISLDMIPHEEAPSFHFKGEEKYYPAPRNPAFTLDRDLTLEYTASHHNNFYEFIHPNIKYNIYQVYRHTSGFDTSDWQFEVGGQCEKKGKFRLEDIIRQLGTEERTYRFRCVERWAMAVPWTGFSLASLLKIFKPNSKARYVRFTSAAVPKQMPGIPAQDWYPWPYVEGLRIEEAMHELSFMATGIFGKPLPKQNGAPMRLIVPWKYGFKNPKSIVKIEFTKRKPLTFWNRTVPDEYPFEANVDPKVDHPRWSQAQERMIPNGDWRPTLPYNGYGNLVAQLYP